MLSVIHSLIPNHWAPLVTLAKTEKWERRETLVAAFITSLSHTASTVLIGIAVGTVGLGLSRNYELITKTAAPAILFLIGLIYIITDFRNSRKGHTHSHSVNDRSSGKKTRRALLITLCIAMFLTPCFEIEAYYFQAALYGWSGIFIVSAVYLVTTILVTILLVNAGLKGISRWNLHFMDHHEKLVTGLVLIILAVLAFVVEL